MTGAVLSNDLVSDLVRRALREDVGGGDVTSRALVEKATVTNAAIISRADCVPAGGPVAREVFRQVDPAVNAEQLIPDGAEARRGDHVLGALGEGEIFGEMGLLERTTRAADVVLTEDSKVIEIEIKRLVRLCEARPRLGKQVMENLARGLSAKLRRK